MKRLILILMCLFVQGLFGITNDIAEVIASAANTNQPYFVETFSTNDYWFPIGEELRFKGLLGFIPIGNASCTINWGELDGKRVLHIHYWAKSNKVISTLYPVDDVIDVYIDPVTFRSIMYEMKLHEGRHFKHEITTFNYDTLTGTAIRLDRDNRKETFKFSPDARGLFTFMYYMRSRGYKIGETETFNVVTDGKEYKLTAKASKVEKINAGDYGKVKAIRVDPKAEFDGIFIKKGKVVAWVSMDPRRLLIRGEVQIPVIADVKFVLEDVLGPGDDSWVDGSAKKNESKEDSKSNRPSRRRR